MRDQLGFKGTADEFHQKLRREPQLVFRTSAELETRYDYAQIVGRSEPMRRVLADIGATQGIVIEQDGDTVSIKTDKGETKTETKAETKTDSSSGTSDAKPASTSSRPPCARGRCHTSQ